MLIAAPSPKILFAPSLIPLRWRAAHHKTESRARSASPTLKCDGSASLRPCASALKLRWCDVCDGSSVTLSLRGEDSAVEEGHGPLAAGFLPVAAVGGQNWGFHCAAADGLDPIGEQTEGLEPGGKEAAEIDPVTAEPS